MPNSWFILGLAIVAEVVATSALKISDGFTHPVPVIVVVAGYGLAVYLMSLALRVLPVGIVYAVWAGVGIVLITVIGWFIFDQKLGLSALAGIGLIIAGVVILNLSSQTSAVGS